MSEVVDSFPPPSRTRVYAWERWTDGAIHVLERGADFDCEARLLCKAARRFAITHGMRVKTARRGDRAWLRFTRAR